MALTDAQKLQLISAYAPILILHRDEPLVPVKPELFVERAALWITSPLTDKKEFWGAQIDPANPFPREPNIPKRGITLSPAGDVEGADDVDGNGVPDWYLGHQDQDGRYPYMIGTEGVESFLDHGAWSATDEVTESSDNRLADIQGAKERWTESPTSFARTMTDWYHAEVSEPSDVERLLLSIGASGGDAVTALRGVLGEVYVIWYYFFYPAHEERLRRCQFALDGGHVGSAEGDWQAVGVVVPQPAAFPWEAPGTPLPTPSHVGYSVRLRGVSRKLVRELATTGMLMRTWDQVSRIGMHPRVFVAKGYHNNYPQPGPQPPANLAVLGLGLEELSCEVLGIYQDVKEDVEDALDDLGDFAEAAGITILKAVAGAGIGASIGGPFGAAIGAAAGLAAGIIEAIVGSDDDDRPTDQEIEAAEMEHAPDLAGYGIVLKPADVANPLVGDTEPPESALVVRTWLGTEQERMIDYTQQVWWPSNRLRPGFDGRWGVRVTNDPLDLRSGRTFPDFGRALMNDLAVGITDTRG